MYLRLLISVLFIGFAQPSLAKISKKAEIKKIKRDRAKLKKIYKKELATAKKQNAQEKIRQQEQILLTEMDPKLAKKARQRIAQISYEWKKSKTIKDWTNNTVPKNRLNRRLHFSRYFSEKIPKFTRGIYSIGIQGAAPKAPLTVLTLVPAKAGLRFVVNGQDYTPKKNESFKKWKSRHNFLTRQKKSAFLQMIIPEAHAQAGRTDIFEMYISMFATSALNNWEEEYYSVGRYPSQEFQNLVNDAIFFRDNYGLQCLTNNAGRFTWYDGNGSRTVDTQPLARNEATSSGATYNDTLRLRFLADSGSTYLAEMSVRSEGNYASVEDFTNPERSSYQTPAVPGALTAILAGQDPSPYTHGNSGGPQDWREPTPAMDSVANIQACTTLHNQGLDVSACDQSVPPNQYSRCLSETFLQSDIQPANTGLLAQAARGVTGNGAWGPLTGMDRQQGLFTKIALLNDFAYQRVALVEPRYPATGSSPLLVRPHGGLYSAAMTREYLAQGQGDEEYHSQVLDCFDASVASRPCNASLLPDNVVQQIQNIGTAFHPNNQAATQTAAQAFEQAQRALEDAPETCQGLLHESRLDALENFAGFQQAEDAGLLESQASFINQAVHMGDVARLVCGNAQARNALFGTEAVPQGGSFSLPSAE